MPRRGLAMLMAMLLAVALSGCSAFGGEVETRMRPPHASGDQEAIQTALEDYIHQIDEEQTSGGKDYVLQYPKMGDYRSAFVIKDIDSNGVNEALAFYRMQSEGTTHINLLRCTDGQWESVDDVEGLSTDVDRVTLGDLDGDGTEELLAGWSMYNTRDRKLVIYTLTDDHFVERFTDTYSHLVVCNMTSPTHKDFLLFRISTTEAKTTARLLMMQNESFTEQGQVYLDGQITEFGKSIAASLSGTVNAVYQDCTKDASTTITEMVCWDGGQLTAPFYNPTEKMTSMTARESGLPCMDIDDDGQIEWPQSSRLPGYEKATVEDTDVWLTEWYSWDVKELQSERRFASIVDQKDGYYIKLPEEWIGRVTAHYDSDRRVLTLNEVDKGVEKAAFLMLRTIALGQTDEQQETESFTFFKQDGTTQYTVWMDTASSLGVDMQKLQQMVVFKTIA